MSYSQHTIFKYGLIIKKTGSDLEEIELQAKKTQPADIKTELDPEKHNLQMKI